MRLKVNIVDNMTEITATITPQLELQFNIPRMLRAHLASIGPNVKVRVDIQKWRKPRTLKQNAMIWGPDYTKILAHILEHTGEKYTEEELHHFHKVRFLGYESSKEHRGLYKLKSTKDLDTAGFSKFREDYCRYWAENGLYLPDPEPQRV